MKYLRLLGGACVCVASTVNAGSMTFEFNVDGVQPSAEGAVYSGSGNIHESAVFPVSGGVLTLNTLQYLPQDAFAYYTVPGTFDPACDLTLEWDAKIWSGVYPGLYGTNTQVSDGMYSWSFFLFTNSMVQGTDSGFVEVASLNATDSFHNYKMVSPANSPNFNFYVDGVLTYSGVGTTTTVNQLRFGDVTTNSGSTLAYWDRISVFNSASDPEPGDINADCKVDIADLLLLQRRILGY